MQRQAAIGIGVGATVIVAAGAAAFAGVSLQQDFAAYYVAGQARRAGLDPYLNHVDSSPWTAPRLWDGVAPFQHSRFLYSPLVAELFRPLAALPYAAAKTVFTALAVAAWLASARLARGGPSVLVAGALFFPLYLHLERGQIDVFVLPLLVLAWRRRNQVAVAGTTLALAGLLKPAAFGLLPVLTALRHARVAAAAAIGGAVLAVMTVALSGPTLTRRYVTEVLPRAILYGEGGTEAMLLPEARFPSVGQDVYRESLWDRPASASLPRLIAPEAPSRATAIAPYLLAMLGLLWAARRVSASGSMGAAPHPSPLPAPRGEGTGSGSGSDPLSHLWERARVRANLAESDRPGELVFWAAAITCVVASPSGWAMGLVWALPIVPIATRALAAGAIPRSRMVGLGAAWVACAVPAPFAGFPALAGAALAIATVATATAPAGPR